MDARVRSLLYDRPELYDLVFPDASATELAMCGEAFRRWFSGQPASAFDLGCGTARTLARLSAIIPDCWGVDFLASNVAYACAVHPQLTIRQGDMRSIRIGRTFDVVMCFGNALSYAITDDDLAGSFATFAAHADAGTLVMFDVLNARCYLDGDGFQERIEGVVDTPSFKATTLALHTLDRKARILRRTRRWHIPGQPQVEDFAEFRLVYPEEARRLAESAGLEWLGVYDNKDLRDSRLTGTVTTAPDCAGMRGRKLYAFARRASAER